MLNGKLKLVHQIINNSLRICEKNGMFEIINILVLVWSRGKKKWSLKWLAVRFCDNQENIDMNLKYINFHHFHVMKIVSKQIQKFKLTKNIYQLLKTIKYGIVC